VIRTQIKTAEPTSDSSSLLGSKSEEAGATLTSSLRRTPTKTERSSIDWTIALLTAGRDRPYAIGLASALSSRNISFDLIGSDDTATPELCADPHVRFLNFRDQQPNASYPAKVIRVLAYYWRLIRYAATTKTKVFHVLWNNKFEFLDRTLLTLYYKLLGKKIILTAHNVNIGKRDQRDSWSNRLSLRTQYRLSNHIFVHTEKMKDEIVSDFAVPESKLSVIPFGINKTVPNTSLSAEAAKRQLNIDSGDKALLFFGNIAPYKGLEYLVAAFAELVKKDKSYRLIIVGKPKGPPDYWKQIEQSILRSGIGPRTIQKIEYVPDEQTELFFKAADVLILPYTRIFQSGVLVLSYNFGLPVIASNVGSLKEEIVEGKTGFVFKPADSSDLARVIVEYFESELFTELERRRPEIAEYATDKYSWSKVVSITLDVYSNVLRN
jgi:D-inositol-3-phosphate glycosyltransferase